MLTPIPTPLCAWLTLLARPFQPLRPDLPRLIPRAMITDAGFVTEALLAITPRRKWPTYFKWLEGGKWSWIAVAQRLCKILVTHFAPPVWYLVIDDTLVPRASKKAPDVGFHFDHSRRAEPVEIHLGSGLGDPGRRRPRQTVATSWAVPLVSRLVRKTGHHGKLTGARVLLRVVRGLFGQGRLLLDTWFMRASVITFALDEGLTVIGQVRKDLALYRPPPARHVGQRGRTPKVWSEDDRTDRRHAEGVPLLPVPLWSRSDRPLSLRRRAGEIPRRPGGPRRLDPAGG